MPVELPQNSTALKRWFVQSSRNYSARAAVSLHTGVGCTEAGQLPSLKLEWVKDACKFTSKRARDSYGARCCCTTTRLGHSGSWERRPSSVRTLTSRAATLYVPAMENAAVNGKVTVSRDFIG